MRASKVCSLTCGLFSVPVKIYKATEDHSDVGFHQYHAGDCLGSVGRRNYCKQCDKLDVDIVRGTEVGDKLVFVSDDELTSLKDEQGKDIEIVQFCEADEVDPLMWEDGYYLEPNGNLESYQLLRQEMSEFNRVAIVRYTPSSRSVPTMGTLRVLGNMLVLHRMRWIDEVRNANELKGLDKPVQLNPQAVKMAHQLVEAYLGEFNPEAFIDGYTERVKELIDAKAQGGSIAAKPQDLDKTADVSDLIAQLEASIARHPAGKKRPVKKAVKKVAPVRRKTA